MGLREALSRTSGVRRGVAASSNGIGMIINSGAVQITDSLFFGADDSNFYALGVEQGEEIWVSSTVESGYDLVRSVPGVYNGNVLFGTFNDSMCYSYDAETGEENWGVETGGSVNCHPLAVDGMAYFGNGGGEIYGFDEETGDEVWSFRAPSYANTQFAHVEDTIFAVGGSNLYAFDAKTGEEQWSYTNPSYTAHGPALYEGTLYITTDANDASVYSVNIDGSEKWTRSPSLYEIPHAPRVANGTVYFGSTDFTDTSTSSKVMALNAETGNTEWTFHEGAEDDGYWNGIFHQGNYYAGCQNNIFYAIDGETGAKVWEYTGGDDIRDKPGVKGESLFIGDNSGVVHALDASTGDMIWTYDTGASRIRGGLTAV